MGGQTNISAKIDVPWPQNRDYFNDLVSLGVPKNHGQNETMRP